MPFGASPSRIGYNVGMNAGIGEDDHRSSDPTRDAYETVAADYAEVFEHELEHKQFDRDEIAAWAGSLPAGPVVDLGAGPGHIGVHVRRLSGRSVIAVDIARAMCDIASRHLPAVQADIRALPFAGGSLAGAVAFYSVIHLEPVGREVPLVLAELSRVLRPGGSALIAVHCGEEDRRTDEWFGRRVSLWAHLFCEGELEAMASSAGLEVRRSVERPPYPHEQLDTTRRYVTVAMPAGTDQAVKRA